MGIFSQPKPRRFRHEYIFVDERKERLKAIESRARNTLGKAEDAPRHDDRIRSTFLNATRHVRRRHERLAAGGFVPGFGLLVVLLLVLFAVWRILI